MGPVSLRHLPRLPFHMFSLRPHPSDLTSQTSPHLSDLTSNPNIFHSYTNHQPKMNCVALLSLLLSSLLVLLVFAVKFIINLQESHLGMYEAVTDRIKVILESNILGCPLPVCIILTPYRPGLPRLTVLFHRIRKLSARFRGNWRTCSCSLATGLSPT